MTTQNINAKIIPILKSHAVLKAALFGSVVRREAKNNSDVDLLVELDDTKSLLDLIGLKLELEDTLETKVDVLTYDAIHPLFRDTILKEQQTIYENNPKIFLYHKSLEKSANSV